MKSNYANYFNVSRDNEILHPRIQLAFLLVRSLLGQDTSANQDGTLREIARNAALIASITIDRAELENLHLVGVSLSTGSGLMAMKRKPDIENRLRRSEKSLRDATEIAEFL